MNDLQQVYAAIFTAELDKIRGDDELQAAVCGPTYVPNDDNEMVVGWMVEIGLKGDEGEYFVSVPIAGNNPSQDVFAVAAAHILEVARAERENAPSLVMDSAPVFMFHCAGQRGDVNGNPVGPKLYTPGHPHPEE
jgi:hypothetical protein